MRTRWDGPTDTPEHTVEGTSSGKGGTSGGTNAEKEARESILQMRTMAENADVRDKMEREAVKSRDHAAHSAEALRRAVGDNDDATSHQCMLPQLIEARALRPCMIDGPPATALKTMCELVLKADPPTEEVDAVPVDVGDIPNVATNDMNDNGRNANNVEEAFEAFKPLDAEAYTRLRQDWERRRDGCAERGEPPPEPFMNQGQRAAVEPMIEHIRRHMAWTEACRQAKAHGRDDATLPPPPTAPLLYLGAGPGCGKSTLLSTLCGCIDKLEPQRTSACTAFMGVAACILPHGRTIHGMFHIDPRAMNKDTKLPPLKNASFLQEMTAKFDLLRTRCPILLLIIDEASMVHPKMLGHIDTRLRQFTGYPMLPFGGLAVIMSGDFCQLPPVGEISLPKAVVDRYVRREGDRLLGTKKRPTKRAKDIAASVRGIDNPASRGTELFVMFQRRTLTEQMRSHGDQDHLTMINAHQDQTNPTPLTARYVRSLQLLKQEDIHDDIAWAYATVAVLGNLERHMLNHEQARRFAKACGHPLIRWRHPLTDSVEIDNLTEAEIDELYDAEPGLWGYFVPGAPAMLLDNLNLGKGLANGTDVTMHSLAFVSEGENTALRAECARVLNHPGAVITLQGRPDFINVRVDEACVGAAANWPPNWKPW